VTAAKTSPPHSPFEPYVVLDFGAPPNFSTSKALPFPLKVRVIRRVIVRHFAHRAFPLPTSFSFIFDWLERFRSDEGESQTGLTFLAESPLAFTYKCVIFFLKQTVFPRRLFLSDSNFLDLWLTIVYCAPDKGTIDNRLNSISGFATFAFVLAPTPIVRQ